MGSNRNAHRKVFARAAPIGAALVTAPKGQQFFDAYAAVEHRPLLAEGGQQHVLRAHRRRGADCYRFLPERRGDGAEPTGTLQIDRLGVVGAGEHHGAVEAHELLSVFGPRWERSGKRAIGPQILDTLDAEARDLDHPGSGG